MATKEEILRNLRSRDTVYASDFEAVLDYVTETVTLGMEWKFDASIVDSDPGNGKMRWNNAVPASVTEIITSDQTDGKVDVSSFLAAITTGHRIYVQEKEDAEKAILCTVSGPSVDNTTHFTIPVTVTGAGLLPDDKKKLIMILMAF